MPVNVTLNDRQNGAHNVSVTLSWSLVTEADNYTITVLPHLGSGLSMFTVNMNSLTLAFNYNTSYTVNIAAVKGAVARKRPFFEKCQQISIHESDWLGKRHRYVRYT